MLHHVIVAVAEVELQQLAPHGLLPRLLHTQQGTATAATKTGCHKETFLANAEGASHPRRTMSALQHCSHWWWWAGAAVTAAAAVTQAVAQAVATACSMVTAVANSNPAGQEAKVHRQQLGIVYGSHTTPLVCNTTTTEDAGTQHDPHTASNPPPCCTPRSTPGRL
jgi:hypothetical protein